jgi:hypothetical protein
MTIKSVLDGSWKAVTLVVFGLFKAIVRLLIPCVTTIAFFCIFVYAAAVIQAYLKNKVPPSSPRLDLQEFVVYQKNLIGPGLTFLDELNVKSLVSYAAAYCLEGTTLSETREALSAGLVGVPKSVRDEIGTTAVRGNISAKNT